VGGVTGARCTTLIVPSFEVVALARVLRSFAHIDFIGQTPGFSVTLMMISLPDVSRHNRFGRCSGSQQAKHPGAEAKQEAEDQAPRR
jgi:hypothetical protein